MANRKTHPFKQLVSENHISEHSFVHKFGHNHDVSSAVESVWAQGGYYNWPTLAEIVTVVSDSPNDANGNIGAHSVTLIGLDTDYNEISEVVVLNGNSNVATSNSFVRMYRAYVNEVGSFQVNAGNITVTHGNTIAGPGSSVTANVICRIDALEGQTEMCVYTIPAGKTGYLYNWSASAAKQGETEVRFMTREQGLSWRVKNRVEVNSGAREVHYAFPLPIQEKTDIEIRAAASVTGVSISAEFDILLIDNDV